MGLSSKQLVWFVWVLLLIIAAVQFWRVGNLLPHHLAERGAPLQILRGRTPGSDSLPPPDATARDSPQHQFIQQRAEVATIGRGPTEDPTSPLPHSPALEPAKFTVLADARERLKFKQPEDKLNEKCKNATYDISKLPKVAIVIPYLHESLELFERTLGSILENTPGELLDEVLVVDDGNDVEWAFKEILPHLHPKVRYHRNEVRQGLIKAKATGADLTTAPVILFLEPHCIVNKRWLEPLVERMLDNPRHVVVPVIDILPEHDPSSYVYVGEQYGGFTWSLEFNWMGTAKARDRKYHAPEPFPMPCMSGGLLAIWRDWWIESGKYDENMTEWGGEHIEMSLRIWRCGGTLEAVPCSRVGHMFRAKRPYVFHGEASYVNKLRVADVWLENHKPKIFEKQHFLKSYSAGDVSARLELKKRLQCKSMDWYIQNIYPELDK